MRGANWRTGNELSIRWLALDIFRQFHRVENTQIPQILEAQRKWHRSEGRNSPTKKKNELLTDINGDKIRFFFFINGVSDDYVCLI